MVAKPLWRSRLPDKRSLKIAIFKGLLLGFAISVLYLVVVFILQAIHEILNLGFKQSRSVQFGATEFLGLGIGVSVVAFLAFYYVLPLVRAWRWRVDSGYKALIKFRGVPTGELIETGPLPLPAGYGYDQFDCRPKPITIGGKEITSKDSFKIRVSFTAHIQLDDPRKQLGVQDSESLMHSIVESEVMGALADTTALSAVSEREKTNAGLLANLQHAIARYGYSCCYSALNIEEIPEHLSVLVQTVDILKSRFPSESVPHLVDTVLSYQGKVDRRRYEIVGVEALVELVAGALRGRRSV